MAVEFRRPAGLEREFHRAGEFEEDGLQVPTQRSEIRTSIQIFNQYRVVFWNTAFVEQATAKVVQQAVIGRSGLPPEITGVSPSRDHGLLQIGMQANTMHTVQASVLKTIE